MPSLPPCVTCPDLPLVFFRALASLFGARSLPPPPPTGQRGAPTCPQCGSGNLGSTTKETILSLGPKPPQTGYLSATGTHAHTLWHTRTHRHADTPLLHSLSALHQAFTHPFLLSFRYTLPSTTSLCHPLPSLYPSTPKRVSGPGASNFPGCLPCLWRHPVGCTLLPPPDEMAAGVQRAGQPGEGASNFEAFSLVPYG